MLCRQDFIAASSSLTPLAIPSDPGLVLANRCGPVPKERPAVLCDFSSRARLLTAHGPFQGQTFFLLLTLLAPTLDLGPVHSF